MKCKIQRIWNVPVFNQSFMSMKRPDGSVERKSTLIHSFRHALLKKFNHTLYMGKKHGAVGPDLELAEVPGLEDRDASVDVSHRVRAVD